MSVIDSALVALVAADLGTEEGLIEKDFHMVRALAVIAGLDHGGAAPVFSGGTSLSKGWELIKRFSEHIDFKIVPLAATNRSAAERFRRAYRARLLDAFDAHGFRQIGAPLVRDEGSFLSVTLDYGPVFPAPASLRRTLRVEATFMATSLPPLARSVQSFVAQAAKQPPELSALLCVDPVETAADKLGALASRTYIRDRSSSKDDPTVVRHLHDLAALEKVALGSTAFPGLVRSTLERDVSRAKVDGLATASMLAAMLPKIDTDAQWEAEYTQFVRNVAFGSDAERISYSTAMATCGRLVAAVQW